MIHAHRSLFLTASALLGGLALFALDHASAAERCPNLGIRIVPEVIEDSQDSQGNPSTQACPTFQVGIGVPGWGHVGIGFGDSTCPAGQTKVEAHAEVVPKQEFKVIANGSYKVYARPVTCETKKNIFLFGLPACNYGTWTETGEYTDFDEELCAE